MERFFSYDQFRPFQRELAVAILEGFRSGKVVVANAPTGLGKTAAALAAALAYAQESGARVLYLVRVKNEMLQPLRELSRLKSKGVELKVAFLRNKQDMCCYRELRGLPYAEFLAECRYLRALGKCQYYPPKPLELRTPLTPKAFIKAACEAGTCAYETAKVLTMEAQVVVATYFYVFSPRAEQWVDLGKSVLIVDEAHSLPDAVASINSVEITEADIRRARSDAERYGLSDVAAMLYRAAKSLREIRPGPLSIGDVLALFDEPGSLERSALEVIKRMIDEGLTPYSPIVSIAEFVKTLKSSGRYVVVAETSEDGLKLRAVPYDVNRLIANVINAAKAVALISGSLPIDLFLKALPTTRPTATFDVPLDRFVKSGNFIAIIDKGVTTKFTSRGEEMYKAIAKRLAAVITETPGGILVVFPSYDVLKGVRKYLSFKIPLYVEARDTDLEDIPLEEKFAVFAVAGGKLAEGVEYVKEGRNLLAAVAVVGVPFPDRDYFLDKRVEELTPTLGAEAAWSAVYLYNAVIKVRQAVGRLFRSPDDRGALIFLDYRYLEPELYLNLKDILRGAQLAEGEEELRKYLREFFATESLAL
ncbi:ATP-dependent DNA helicase [Thermoproteus tenax]|uniref:XPD/Rad3-related DNA helicase n=1 Tax=Thermoproteus tenax (strain ATCC 35583 / DSM 2078 / JCM 9277 / NBRC 100435 / Kra 1) TaxID=768679 RepID=G4RKI3_THETK|nr:ATP-dependent DNA helicase [Thermoproteus tenax]CCC82078.1 XPD/Rad3-related DNA helicase [Thermoproteus tenax Kra 1]